MQLENPSLRMQLEETSATKRPKETSLKQKLRAATHLLLGATVIPAITPAIAIAEEPWHIDSALLIYSESDQRVQAFEPTLFLKKKYAERETLQVKLVLDSLTGATPTGALPQNTSQVFTRPSGDGSYTIAPQETPIDDTFKDTRAEINVGYTKPWSRLTLLNYGAHLSREYDFDSLGANFGIARDINQRNTTLNVGIGLEMDQFRPEGGIPIPFSAMQLAGTPQPRESDSDTKNVIDFLAGITQVINPHWLMQINYSLSRSSGYLADPFKYLSVLEDNSYLLAASDSYRFEARPDTRTKQSLFVEHKIHTYGDTVTASYRYFWDDWGIDSHTLDLRYRWNINSKNYVEPHVRFYNQSQAEFYHPYLLTSHVAGLEQASADYRLAQFDGLTFGIKWGHVIHAETEWNVRIEQYQQKGQLNDIPAPLQNLEIFPDMSAMILQFGYSFVW